jgi:hypothetical protein
MGWHGQQEQVGTPSQFYVHRVAALAAHLADAEATAPSLLEPALHAGCQGVPARSISAASFGTDFGLAYYLAIKSPNAVSHPDAASQYDRQWTLAARGS